MHMVDVYDTLHLLLIPRDCTPSDADLILKIKKKGSIIAVSCEHAKQATTATADIVELTKGIFSVQNSEHGSLCK